MVLVDWRALGVEVALRVREARHGLTGQVNESPDSGAFRGLERVVRGREVVLEDHVWRVVLRARDRGGDLVAFLEERVQGCGTHLPPRSGHQDPHARLVQGAGGARQLERAGWPA